MYALGIPQPFASRLMCDSGVDGCEVMFARLPGIAVPNGFTIPFSYYDEFIKHNQLDDVIFGLLNDQKFVHDPAYRRDKLVKLREQMATA